MAVTRNNPYSGFNFLVEIDGLVDAGFSEISGLGHEIAVIEYREGSDRRGAVLPPPRPAREKPHPAPETTAGAVCRRSGGFSRGRHPRVFFSTARVFAELFTG